jgi:demethylmenaquinone methyltransferase/2-methoxy-6-polyprenyl-1,4-benzoquinol methylase
VAKDQYMKNAMPSGQAPISRVIRSRQATRASYDRLSGWYDLLSGASERALIVQGLQYLDTQEGEKVLEIGPGTGYALAQLARSAGTSGKACGVDLSGRMCLRARVRLAAASGCPKTLLSCADAVFLPLPTGVMDAIFMAFTLELFDTPEIPQVLAECRRVLKPGGRLGVVVMSMSDGKPSLVLRLYEWAHHAMPNTVDCRPILAEEALQQAGFEIASVCIRSLWGLPVKVMIAGKQV